MLRKLIALGVVAGLSKKAWDYYNTAANRPVAAGGRQPAPRTNRVPAGPVGDTKPSTARDTKA